MSTVDIELDIVKSFDEKTGTMVVDLTENQRELLIEYAINDILRKALIKHESSMTSDFRDDDYEHNDYYYDTDRNR